VIVGTDPLDTWKKAVTQLIDNKSEIWNLTLRIENPNVFDSQWLKKYNPRAVDGNSDSLNDVINTIFPMKLYQRHPNRPDLYETYWKCFDRIKRIKHGRIGWGSYFERLTRFGEKNYNQLDTTINKINEWEKTYKAAFVFHLSDPSIDKPRPRNLPCWQFGELLFEGDKIHFMVVYRNHDYFGKALGNLIALGQLQNFICSETNHLVGELICHSAHAYYINKTKILELAEGT